MYCTCRPTCCSLILLKMFASRYTVCHKIIPLQVVEVEISKFCSVVSLLIWDVNVHLYTSANYTNHKDITRTIHQAPGLKCQGPRQGLTSLKVKDQFATPLVLVSSSTKFDPLTVNCRWTSTSGTSSVDASTSCTAATSKCTAVAGP